jgi:serine phosphatase RsbU (regulator of sigma subunit)
VLSTNTVFNGVRLSTLVTPADHAEQGGDWCETFVVSQDVIALSIGDVCGHGVDAFQTMLVARRAVRDAAFRGFDPAQVLTAANRAVCDLNEPETYASALFVLLDTRNGTLSFANAGHPPPLMVGSGGSAFLSYPVCDLPLGVKAVLKPVLHVASKPAHTLLVLYTDGVTEHERRDLRGAAQLRNAAIVAARRHVPPTARIIEELMLLTTSNPDDASILAAWTPRAAIVRHRDRPRPPAHPALVPVGRVWHASGERRV